MPKRTEKFAISRILSATATLVTNAEDAESARVNQIVLGRAAYLIQGIYRGVFPRFGKRRFKINDFWRRVQVQAKDDMEQLTIIWDGTMNPPPREYGQAVRIAIKVLPGHISHFITISAKENDLYDHDKERSESASGRS